VLCVRRQNDRKKNHDDRKTKHTPNTNTNN